MKIAFVYDAIYPWVKGGAEKRIYELGKRLVEMGNEVHVFGIKWWDGKDIIEYEGMVLHGVCGAMELYVNGRRSISEAVIFSIKLLPQLMREKFDIIDVSAFPYFSCFSVKIVSMIRRTPMIITWHEIWKDYWYEYLGWMGILGKIVEIMVSKLTTRSIAVSDMTGKGLESLGVKSQNISIVPNGIDLAKIEAINKSIYRSDIIFVGRLIKEKNVDILLEAVNNIRKNLPDIKLNIIGDGHEKERLLGIVTNKKLQKNVSFNGFMDYDDVISWIKSSKVLVLPSSREGFGMVVIESFACGVPVITVNSTGNAAKELVSEETGFVVELDAIKLGETILKMITDEVVHENKSGSTLNTARKYDWNKISRKLAYIYED